MTHTLDPQANHPFQKALEGLLYDAQGQLREDRYSTIIPPQMQEDFGLEPLDEKHQLRNPTLLINIIALLAQNDERMLHHFAQHIDARTLATFYPDYEEHFSAQPFIVHTPYSYKGTTWQDKLQATQPATERGGRA